MNDLTPKARRQKRTHQAILDAAREIIVKGGQDALSMRKIARKIDYSPAGLYEYFTGKEEIILVLCDEADQRLAAYMNRVDPTLPLPEQLLELGLAYIDFALNNREQFLMLFTQVISRTNDHQGAGEPGPSFMVLYNIIQQMMQAGLLDNQGLDTLSMSYTAWGLVHGLAMLQVTTLKDQPLPFAPANRWALEQFIKGIQKP